MSVLRLFVVNSYERDCSLIFHGIRNSQNSRCKPFTILQISPVSSCFNWSYNNQTLKYDKQCNINFRNSFRYYSQTKQDIYKCSDIDSGSAPKLIYNSVIKFRGFVAEKRRQNDLRRNKLKSEDQRDLKCVALKYFMEEVLDQSEKACSLEKDKEESIPNIPYSIHKSVLINNESNDFEFVNRKENTDYNIEEDNQGEDNLNSSLVPGKTSVDDVKTLINDNTSISHKNWMFDYEHYKDTEDIEYENENRESQDWRLNYGTSNPYIPASKVPCGGCGALLHCQDPSFPGYLPTEIFEDLNVVQLRGTICQRCHFLKEYNTALGVNVDPKEYPKILSKIKDENALVILMVDMTDFPCSIWPGILNIIGSKRKLFVVGNKVDLLQGDTKNWLDHAKKSLEAALPVNANIKHLSLISAKTGFGVEDLINKLFNVWEYRGDVYLVGCTNVGKSTLFNTLLQSDYCKVKAVDLLQRATTSPWPGTTLNLLKFPIQRPEGWKLFYRTKRLQHERSIMDQEKKLLQQQNIRRGSSRKEPLQLIGHVGRTFKNDVKKKDIQLDPFSFSSIQELQKSMSNSGLNPTDKDFIDGRWLYDTPGTVQPDQIIDLLTIDELMKTLPKTTIIPRTFLIEPDQSLFIGGLARLDYLEGKLNLKFTVCAAHSLPVTVCHTDDAKEVYDYYIGTKVLQVPFGDDSRMKAWTGLQSGQKFVLRGISHNESCADVVLSSAGWVAVTAGPQEICRFLAWTPQARGIHVRIPPVLPYAVNLRGNRISQTIAYKVSK